MLMITVVRSSTTCESRQHDHKIAVVATSLSSFTVSVPGLVTPKRACAGTPTLLRSPVPGRAWELGCGLLQRNGLPGHPHFDNVAEVGIPK